MASGVLSDLFLYVSDCDPGCGCGADVFIEDPARIDTWLEEQGPMAARAALEELERLATPPVDQYAVGLEVQYAFESEDEARAWLLRWADLVRAAIARTASTPDA